MVIQNEFTCEEKVFYLSLIIYTPSSPKSCLNAFKTIFGLLHDTDILGLAYLSASTNISLEIIEGIQKKHIKLTGKAWGYVFLFCDIRL